MADESKDLEGQEKTKPKKPKFGMTETEFFEQPNLRALKANIFVNVLGRKRFNDETQKLEVVVVDKEIKAPPSYWLSIHRTYKDDNDLVGTPTDPQELVAYELEGEKYLFKK